MDLLILKSGLVWFGFDDIRVWFGFEFVDIEIWFGLALNLCTFIFI